MDLYCTIEREGEREKGEGGREGERGGREGGRKEGREGKERGRKRRESSADKCSILHTCTCIHCTLADHPGVLYMYMYLQVYMFIVLWCGLLGPGYLSSSITNLASLHYMYHHVCT